MCFISFIYLFLPWNYKWKLHTGLICQFYIDCIYLYIVLLFFFLHFNIFYLCNNFIYFYLF